MTSSSKKKKKSKIEKRPFAAPSKFDQINSISNNLLSNIHFNLISLFFIPQHKQTSKKEINKTIDKIDLPN